MVDKDRIKIKFDKSIHLLKTFDALTMTGTNKSLYHPGVWLSYLGLNLPFKELVIKYRGMGHQNLFKWRRFFVTLPQNRDEKASGSPPLHLSESGTTPPLVIVVRMLCNDMTVGHYRSYGTRTAAMSWIMRHN